MKLTVFLLLTSLAFASELPDAPHLKMRPPVETYSPNERLIVHNTPSIAHYTNGRVFDWPFLTINAVYGLSNAFDNYETQKNLYSCAFEGNADLGRTPTAGAQARHGAIEFAAVLAGGALFKWYGIRHNVPKWLNYAGSSLPAAIGTGKHIQGGMAWVNLCK